MTTPPFRQIRAAFDQSTITVYQAYSPAIADAAVGAGRFVPPFRLERMTWIKPSFLWMMYRCGWATKPGQERVLAIRLTRAGFEQALAQASLSHFEAPVHGDHAAWLEQQEASPVRVQWDPERDLDLNPLPYRSIQIGLGGSAARSYVHDWVTQLDDITDFVVALRDDRDRRAAELPREQPYPVSPAIEARLGMDSAGPNS